MRQLKSFFRQLPSAALGLALSQMLCWPLQLYSEVAISIPGCGVNACDNSGGGSAYWPSPSNFSVCNNTVNPLTVMGWRFRTQSWGSYGSNGGGSFTVSGSGPYTYEKRVPLWDQIRPPGSCLTTHDVSGSIGAGANGQPYDWDVLLKTGSCNPADPVPTPTPMACADVAAARLQPSYYSSACIPDTLGKNGGPHSGGLIDTFFGQTQIQIGIPTTTWSESSTTVTFDPYASMGNSPMYLMATAMGQEYFNLDMQFMFGIGSKESFAGMRQVPGGALFIPTNAAGVAGTYHVESFTFATILAGYPSFFPAYACVAGYPNVTTAIGTPCMPSANDPLYFYMSQNAGSPLINNNAAQLVNSVVGGGLNFYRLYDALVASTDLCFLNLLENGNDDEAAVKLLPAGYNLGWNSTWINSLPPSAAMLAASDITPYTVMGNSNYRDEVLRTAHNLEAASACPMAGGIYDPPILQSDLQTFFFGNGGSAAAQGSGGLMLHFSLSAAERTALWNDVLCAFNALKGLAPGRAANEVSFRYDFLTILRVAKQHFTTNRPYPTQADFTSWVDSHSNGASACGTPIDTAFPFVSNLSPAQNSNVCPDFLVSFNSTDNAALERVEWSLDPDWLAWNPANPGGGSAYSFTAPGSDPNFPASGPGKLWIRSTDSCGNSTLRQLDFNVNCGTPTFTPTRTRTRSPTLTSTPSRTPSPSPSASPSPSSTRSASPSPSASPTRSFSPSPSSSPSMSPSPTGSGTASPSATLTPSASVSSSFSPSPSATYSATRTGSPTQTSTRSQTFSPTASPSPTSSRTVSESPTASFTPPDLSPTNTMSPGASATATYTISATRSASPSFTPTQTLSPTRTSTLSPTASSSPTLSQTASESPTASPTPLDPSATNTMSPGASATVTRTISATLSATLTFSLTDTPAGTLTETPTLSASPSWTGTPSGTLTSSGTASVTATRTRSPSPSHTPTASASGTLTQSQTATRTVTVGPSATPSPSPSPSAPATPAVTATARAYFEQESLIKVRAFYPNPFRDDLKIYLNLRVAAKLRVTVYNVAGEMITAIEENRPAGPAVIVWAGVNESGGRCASGTYVLHLKGVGVDMSTDDFWGHVVIAR